MSVALVDVNVLIALVDDDHVFHPQAVQWFVQSGRAGWATCPMVENGAIRILSQPNYPNMKEASPVHIIAAIKQLRQQGNHHFWSDSVTLLEEDLFDAKSIVSPRQITDAYLVGLAHHKGGRLVTFDRGITPVYLRNKKAKVVEWI